MKWPLRKEKESPLLLVREEEEGKLGFGMVRYTRSFGKKRVSTVSFLTAAWMTPLKLSPLETLPQDILIKILCGVDHEDLKQLIHVSKIIRDATLIAKEWHFGYITPSKARLFRSLIDFGDSSEELEEIEAPKAPKQSRSCKSRLGGKDDLGRISVALFSSPRRKGVIH